MRETIKDIAEAVHGRILSGSPDTVIEHLAIDSRTSDGNDLFIPVIGARTDAHDFIPQALANGCTATLTSRTENPVDETHAWIQVEDTIDALHDIGRLVRRHCTIPAIGVTGSVGKTTTREMVACALSAGKKVFRTGKNYNSSIGLPITLSQMSDADDVAVLELGMNVPGELGMISDIADLTAAVLTNVGVAHIEYYGTQEKICEEKYSITRGFHNGRGFLIINGDDPLLYAERESTVYPYVLYGTGEHCEYRAVNLRVENGRSAFDFTWHGNTVPVRLSVLGEHNVRNACAALAAADYFGVDVAAAAKALAEFTGFVNRLQIIPMDTFTVIDDTYNASPDSMKAGLKVLSAYEPAKRRIAVLGDMKELGPQSALFHRQVGEAAASENIDRMIVIGDLGRAIAEGALASGCRFTVDYAESNEAAARMLWDDRAEGDVIYLKASNSMHLKEITARLKEFLA